MSDVQEKLDAVIMRLRELQDVCAELIVLAAEFVCNEVQSPCVCGS